jgi:hypothetical protein
MADARRRAAASASTAATGWNSNWGFMFLLTERCDQGVSKDGAESGVVM